MFKSSQGLLNHPFDQSAFGKRSLACSLALSLVLSANFFLSDGFSLPAHAQSPGLIEVSSNVDPSVIGKAQSLFEKLQEAIDACDEKAYNVTRKNIEDLITNQRNFMKPIAQDFRDAIKSFSNLMGELVSKLYPPRAAIGQQLYMDGVLEELNTNPGQGMVEVQKHLTDHLNTNSRLRSEDAQRLKVANERLKKASQAYAQLKPTEEFLKELEHTLKLQTMLFDLCKKPRNKTLGGAPPAKPLNTTDPTLTVNGDVERAKVALELYLDRLKRAQKECDRKKYDEALVDIQHQLKDVRKLVTQAEEAYKQALRDFDKAAHEALPSAKEGEDPGKQPSFFWPMDIEFMKNSPNKVEETIRDRFEKTIKDTTGVTSEQRKSFEQAAQKLREAGLELQKKQQLKDYLDKFEFDLLKYPFVGKDCSPPKDSAQHSMAPVNGTGVIEKQLTVGELVSMAEFVDEETDEPIKDHSISYFPGPNASSHIESVAVFRDHEAPPDTDKNKQSIDDLLPEFLTAQVVPQSGDRFVVHSPHYASRSYTVPESGVTPEFINVLKKGTLPLKPLSFVTGDCEDMEAVNNIQRDLANQNITFGPGAIMKTPMPLGLCQVTLNHYEHPKGRWSDFSGFPHTQKSIPHFQGGAAVKPNPDTNPKKPNKSSSGAPKGTKGTSKPPVSQPVNGAEMAAKAELIKNSLYGNIPQPGNPGWYEPVQERECQQGEINLSYFDSKGSWSQDYDDMWALKRVGMTRELLSTLPQRPITIAVIDSGVDLTHPDLKGQLWTNRGEIESNGKDDDGNGFVDDVYGWNFTQDTPQVQDENGHGTMVAGIISAKQRDGLGVSGLFPSARIMPLKVTQLNSKGNSIDLARAIVYAADHGASIINLSVGGDKPTWIEQKAVDYANSKGVLLVAAAGNEGKTALSFSPAGLAGVFSVGSTDLNNKRAIFSNWGTNIALVAPGVDVLSLRAKNTDFLQYLKPSYIPGSAFVGPNARYYRASGSSFSAPFVSATAALLLSQSNGLLTRQQLIGKLTMGATDIGWPGRDQETGYGLLNIQGAMGIPADQLLAIALQDVRTVKGQEGVYLEISGLLQGQGLQSGWLELTPNWQLNETTIWQRIPGEKSAQAHPGLLWSLPVERFKEGKQWTLRLKGKLKNGQERFTDYQIELD